MFRLVLLTTVFVPCLHAAPQELTLREVLERVEHENPHLAAFTWELRAAEARVLQAGLRPNPELSLEVEDLRLGRDGGSAQHEEGLGIGSDGTLQFESSAGSGGDSLGRLEGAEVTLSVAQLVELGGKRAKRLNLTTAEQEAVALEYELLRTEILSEAAGAFADALRAQEATKLAEDLLELLLKTEEVIRLRVEGGKEAPLELKRGRSARLLQENLLQERQSEERAARTSLAGFWSGAADEFGPLAGRLDQLEPLPGLEQLQSRVLNNSEILRWAAETEVRQARLTLEQAQARPDLTLRLGIRTQGVEAESSRGWRAGTEGISFWRDRGADADREHSLVLEMALPLPVFHRNQGAINEAEYLRQRAEAEGDAARAAVQNALTRLHGLLTDTGLTLRQLEQETLPLAEDAAKGARVAYREGKLSLLEWLDTEQAVMTARERRVNLLSAWHKHRLELEQLLGGNLTPPGTAGTEDIADETGN